jgi:hypothetical protein
MEAPILDTYMSKVDDDRRRGRRLPLRLQTKLIRRSGIILSTTTENLSSSGFYCHTSERLIPGEEFDCYIMLQLDAAPSLKQVVLLCRGRVARVESVAADVCGAGCEIDDYLLVSE